MTIKRQHHEKGCHEITGDTGEGTGKTGTDGYVVTGKSGEGIGSTGIGGSEVISEPPMPLRSFTNIVEVS